MLNIRAATPGDLPLITAAAAQTARIHATPAELARAGEAEASRRGVEMTRRTLSSPGGICLIGELEGRPVAYELLMLHEDDLTGLHTALKVDGWVDPAYRRRGINQIMHEAGEHYCRQAGVQRMVCVVAAHNAASVAATTRSGFETERLVRAKWLLPLR
jgi:RimJ/RimL family protein N-acetyltransferase